jgi:hypothetical protein
MEIHGFPAMGCDGKLAGNHLTFPMKYEATRLPAIFISKQFVWRWELWYISWTCSSNVHRCFWHALSHEISHEKNQPSSAFMHLNAMFQGIPLFWRVQTPIIGAGPQFGQAIGRFGYNLEPQAARYKHSFHQGVTRHRSIWTAQWARLDIYLHVSYNHKSKQYQKQLYHIYSIQWKLPNVHVCIYAYMQSWMKGWINGWMY